MGAKTDFAFDSRMCYRFRSAGGAIWEISVYTAARSRLGARTGRQSAVLNPTSIMAGHLGDYLAELYLQYF